MNIYSDKWIDLESKKGNSYYRTSLWVQWKIEDCDFSSSYPQSLQNLIICLYLPIQALYSPKWWNFISKSESYLSEDVWTCVRSL